MPEADWADKVRRRGGGFQDPTYLSEQSALEQYMTGLHDYAIRKFHGHSLGLEMSGKNTEGIVILD